MESRLTCLFIKSLLIISINLFSAIPFFGQDEKNCIDYVSKDTFLYERKIHTDSLINEFLKSKLVFSRSPLVIQVVIHVLWNVENENISDKLINSQIEVLNQTFSDENNDLNNVPSEFKNLIGSLNIKFCLSNFDPFGNPSNGINRVKTDIKNIGLSDELYYTSKGGADAWDSEKYLNIWVANTGNLYSGFGSYPNQTSIEKTGIVIHPKYFGINNHSKYGLGKTTIHEVGHFFGLNHLWGNDSDCLTDDEVEDTPLQLNSHKNCPKYPQMGCSKSEMFMNYMDYVDDQCMFFFTKGQAERMLATIQLFRAGLLNSNVECNNRLEATAGQVRIYPNPSNGEFNIESDLNTSNFVNLYNSIGQSFIKPKRLNENGFSIDIAEMPAGLYFISIGLQTFKIVKL
jgi:hypothetical protein